MERVPASPPTAQLIRPLLEAAEHPGLDADRAVDRLACLVDLLAEWSRRINLTGHQGVPEIVSGILARALGLSSLVPSSGSVADLGSGAGFPGLPLAVLRPGLEVTLVESRTRRHHFQQHVVRTLGLENARPRLGRAEQLAPSLHDVVIAQAVGPPAGVAQLARPWVRPGGVLLIPGLTDPPETLPEGYQEATLTTYCLPSGGRSVPVWVGTASIHESV